NERGMVQSFHHNTLENNSMPSNRSEIKPLSHKMRSYCYHKRNRRLSICPKTNSNQESCERAFLDQKNADRGDTTLPITTPEDNLFPGIIQHVPNFMSPKANIPQKFKHV